MLGLPLTCTLPSRSTSNAYNPQVPVPLPAWIAIAHVPIVVRPAGAGSTSG